MAISFGKFGNYERYQVRVRRHGKIYSRTFPCGDGKRKALAAAKEWERQLLELLDAEPLTTSGLTKDGRRVRSFYAMRRVERGKAYAVATYRDSEGAWRSVVRSEDLHGPEQARATVVRLARQRHCPAPQVPRKKLPSKSAVARRLGG